MLTGWLEGKNTCITPSGFLDVAPLNWPLGARISSTDSSMILFMVVHSPFAEEIRETLPRIALALTTFYVWRHS